MWYLILAIVFAIYGLVYLYIPKAIGGFIGFYIITPLLWIILGIIVLLIARNEGLNIWSFKKVRKWEIGKSPFQGALLIGGFQISLLIIIGLFVGFGSSPYAHTPIFLLLNGLYLGSVLVAIELSRAYLIKKGSSRQRNPNLTLVFVTILFLIISIPYVQYTLLDTNDPASIFKFIGEYLIPSLAMGLFASYLAYLGGALASIGYMGVVQAFSWYSPYLPAVEWQHIAFIGTIAPAIGFLIIQNSVQLRLNIKKRKRMKEPALPWMGVALICTVLILFSFGYLGPEPTIIYSGSMQPNIEIGDIVIVSEINVNEIEEGDIIQFKTSEMEFPIIHRVIEIQGEDDNLQFITKGDDNVNPDTDPVLQEYIIGKVVFKIPKIGWISIGIKDLFKNIGIRF